MPRPPALASASPAAPVLGAAGSFPASSAPPWCTCPAGASSSWPARGASGLSSCARSAAPWGAMSTETACSGWSACAGGSPRGSRVGDRVGDSEGEGPRDDRSPNPCACPPTVSLRVRLRGDAPPPTRSAVLLRCPSRERLLLPRDAPLACPLLRSRVRSRLRRPDGAGLPRGRRLLLRVAAAPRVRLRLRERERARSVRRPRSSAAPLRPSPRPPRSLPRFLERARSSPRSWPRSLRSRPRSRDRGRSAAWLRSSPRSLRLYRSRLPARWALRSRAALGFLAAPPPAAARRRASASRPRRSRSLITCAAGPGVLLRVETLKSASAS